MPPQQSHHNDNIQAFRQQFQHAPQFLVQAPGRVNLIGEHTDYNLLPVLPMPISRFITLTVSSRPDQVIQIHSTQPDHSPLRLSLDQPITRHPEQWANYPLAALQALLAHTGNSSGEPPRGFNALVHADLPPAAGLSSSSALVIATCLTFLHVNNIEMPRPRIAELMRLAEQFVGTAGGGMDQAAITLGEPHQALLIEFDPLSTRPVPIPDGLEIFIVNSGQKAEKSGAARYNFNRRALECVLGVELLKANDATSHVEGSHAWESLRDIYHSCQNQSLPWQPLLAHLPQTGLSPAQIEQLIPRDRLQQLAETKKLCWDQHAEWLPDECLRIAPRVQHVLGEADRVYALEKAFERGDLPGAFELSQASHASCRDLYDISTPRIETLIHQLYAIKAGSVRITGAGFGGCVVALVRKDDASAFHANALHLDPNTIHAQSHGGAQIVRL